MKKIVFSLFLIIFLICIHNTAFAYTISFEQEMTSAGNVPKLLQKIWIKDNKMRMEVINPYDTAQKAIYITKEDGMYNYIPKQNLAVKVSNNGEQKDYIRNLKDFLKFLKGKDAVKIGNDVINGKSCDIYEYTESANTTSNMDTKFKVWVWREKKFPLKMEVSSQIESFSMLNKNIVMNKPISDNNFELPKDAKIMVAPSADKDIINKTRTKKANQ